MLRHFYFYLFAFSCFLLFSCSNLPKEITTAERLMETAPDSALHILQNIPPTHFQTSVYKALYGLLLFQALDKNYMTLQPDTMISFSIHYFEQ